LSIEDLGGSLDYSDLFNRAQSRENSNEDPLKISSSRSDLNDNEENDGIVDLLETESMQSPDVSRNIAVDTFAVYNDESHKGSRETSGSITINVDTPTKPPSPKVLGRKHSSKTCTQSDPEGSTETSGAKKVGEIAGNVEGHGKGIQSTIPVATAVEASSITLNIGGDTVSESIVPSSVPKSEPGVTTSVESASRATTRRLTGSIGISGDGCDSACGKNSCSICQKFSYKNRLKNLNPPNMPPISQFAEPYARSVRVMNMMNSSTCPRDIIGYLLLALKWLFRDAIEVSGKTDYLGADLMFPIIVLVLINAKIPNMHLLLNVLRNFGELDKNGEAGA
jgi:hypothetical protein